MAWFFFGFHVPAVRCNSRKRAGYFHSHQGYWSLLLECRQSFIGLFIPDFPRLFRLKNQHVITVFGYRAVFFGQP